MNLPPPARPEPDAPRPRSVWHRLDLWLARCRPHRVPLALLADALVVVAAWNITYLFRLGFERWLSARPDYDGAVLAGVVAVYLVASWVWRVPQGLWRFSGFGEVKRLTAACLSAGVLAALVVMGLGLSKVPRAVLALHPVVTLMGVVLVRIAYRMLYEHARARITGSDREIRRAIVLGAGGAARRLLAGIHRQGWIVLALLDDDPAKQGARLAGVPVAGPLEAVREPRVRGAATHVIVAMPTATPAQRRRALALAGETGLPVLTVPEEPEAGERLAARLRAIEPEDLLGREPVVLDEAGIGAVLADKTVLVTGAGGSIGSELCRQIARFGPARLVLLELSEFNLYTAEQDLAARAPGLEVVPLIGDVRDLDAMRALMQRWQPQVVFHAAACKHVPLMEGDNAWAALHTNTLGTWRVGQAAAEAGAERFVLISTDKAVNPTNVMGASKRAAEIVVSHLATLHGGTRFMAVRFGNVLGSSGSVFPKFKQQIERGGPVTVTHPDVIRYFMTIPEACRLVLQAAGIGCSGQVLVLEMGEPVRIADLARQLIRLAGHRDSDVELVYSGLRPGEKLYEELLADADTTLPTSAAGVRMARLHGPPPGRAMQTWLTGAEQASRDRETVRRLLAEMVPEYRAA